MSNIKVVYDCEKKTTAYLPLSGAEIAHIEALKLPSILEQSNEEIPTE